MKRNICLFLISCAFVYAGCGDATVSDDIGWQSDVIDRDFLTDQGIVPDSIDDPDVIRDVQVDNTSDSSVTDDGNEVPDAGDSDAGDVPEIVESTEINYLVITSDSLADSAADLAAYRQSKGYRTNVMTRSEVLGSEYASTANWENSARGLIEQFADKLPEGETMFVVLVGDAEAVSAEGFNRPIPTVDCDNVLTGICYTDNSIGDFDSDHVPEVAVGRITASTNTEVRDYIDKIKRHESSYSTGLFNRRVSLYVGEAGFGQEVDLLLEFYTFKALDLVSHAFDVIGAYDSENSSYYYSPFHEKVVDLINEGALMTLYIGHGNADWTQGLTIEQLDEIDCVNRLPVMVFLACLNGDFDNGSDSISEGVLHLENGPVAVFASSDESHPVGNAVLAYEISRAGLEQRPATAGELFMKVKDQMIYNNDTFRGMVNDASTAFGEQGADDPQRIYREHADLYNLLGDPAVEMKFPPASVDNLELTGSLSEKSVSVNGTVSGFSQGSAYVTIAVSRGEILGELISDPETDVEIQTNWALANDKVFAGQTVDVIDGVFSALLEWDETIGSGDRYVKVYAWDGFGIGEGAVDAVGEAWINQ